MDNARISGPVDVLAVMDQLRGCAIRGCGCSETHPAEITAARAAVAELIEALRMSDEWIREAVNFGGCKLKVGQTLYRNHRALANAGHKS